MAKGNPPPKKEDVDYNPPAPPREEMSDDTPGANEYEPPRNRNANFMSVLIAIVVVAVLAVVFFMTRGGPAAG